MVFMVLKKVFKTDDKALNGFHLVFGDQVSDYESDFDCFYYIYFTKSLLKERKCCCILLTSSHPYACKLLQLLDLDTVGLSCIITMLCVMLGNKHKQKPCFNSALTKAISVHELSIS